MTEYRLILASASPRRKYLLTELGFDFEVIPSTVDESSIAFVSPHELAVKAALAKANDVAARYKDALVIGADTIVCLDDHILGKPRNRKEARRMLESLRGRAHTVITGVAIAPAASSNALLDATSTKVFFKRFTRRTLLRYLDSGDSLDKAGAYGIQGIGERLVHHIEGDYFNVMGLPLKCLLGLLANFIDVRPYLERLRLLRRPF